jgi:hypothetical protein
MIVPDAAEVARARRERPVEIDGIPGRTVKLTIDGVDCYLMTAWDGRPGDGGDPVYFAMVVSGGRNKNPLLEVVFDHARALLAGGTPVRGLIAAWRGTQFEPRGVCPQLGAIVSSPLDAVARYLERFLPAIARESDQPADRHATRPAVGVSAVGPASDMHRNARRLWGILARPRWH